MVSPTLAQRGLREGATRILAHLGVLPLVAPTVVGQAVPRTVMRCLEEVVGEPAGPGLMSLPKPASNLHFGVATHQEATLVRNSPAR